MIPEVVPEQAFVSFKEQHSLSFSPPIKLILSILTPCEFRVSTELQSYFLQTLLHKYRLSAQTRIVTLKATTVDRLNNDWSSKTVPGIQHKQDSTFYQRNLNLANRPHCQLAESATNNKELGK